jgi:transposase
MAQLYWLSDRAWSAVEPHLPHGLPGKPRVDDRRVISGILHVLKTGCRWRDVPPAYGPPTTIYNRFTRWSRRGVWQRMFERMAAAGPVPEELSLDSTHVKTHRSAQTTKGGPGRKRSASHGAARPARSMVWPILKADRSPSP